MENQPFKCKDEKPLNMYLQSVIKEGSPTYIITGQCKDWESKYLRDVCENCRKTITPYDIMEYIDQHETPVEPNNASTIFSVWEHKNVCEKCLPIVCKEVCKRTWRDLIPERFK